jgi:enoyl-CoA hydratase/carnithine racemase
MQTLLYEKRDKIVYITLNRPKKLNAFSEELRRETKDAWIRFKDDEDAWVAIVSGAGDHFSVGLDLSEGPITVPLAQSLLQSIPSTHEIWKPTIAAVTGYCLGGGWLLAQDCDLRVAAEDAQFGLPEAKWNLVTIFSGIFHHYLPPSLALEYLLVGDPMSGRRAYEIGFVNRVLPKDQVIGVSTQIAEKLIANGPIGVRRIKELFYRGMELSKHQIMEFTWQLFAETLKLEDTAEGLEALSMKRNPQYKAR